METWDRELKKRQLCGVASFFENRFRFYLNLNLHNRSLDRFFALQGFQLYFSYSELLFIQKQHPMLKNVDLILNSILSTHAHIGVVYPGYLSGEHHEKLLTENMDPVTFLSP